MSPKIFNRRIEFPTQRSYSPDRLEVIEMSNSSEASEPWDVQQARNLYSVHRWGAEYFDINEAGRVIAKPLRDAGASVDLTDVIEEAKARGLKFPVLIRFQDILRHRVEQINMAFRGAIAEFS
jgi:arginine decarboxylase